MMSDPLWSDDAGPIKDVWTDMPVLDVSGAEIGRVELVKMGDGPAVTTKGQTVPPEGGMIGALVRSVGGGEPDAPAPVAEHLLRVGFVKVDGKGPLGRDLYVAADQIDSVAGGCVRLLVGPDELAAEQ